MTNDPEIQAMAIVSAALADLDDAARERVLHWLAQRFGVGFDERKRASVVSNSGGSADGARGAEFAEFVDLFDRASPRTDIERALVGGYWFQVGVGSSDFQAQAVNSALKELGYGIGNITLALGALERRRPALVRQVTKAGRTKQARKKYKLTAAGIAEVRAMCEAVADL